MLVLSPLDLERALDPTWLCSRVSQRGRLTDGHEELLALALACAAVVLLHVPELLRGVRELARATAAWRAEHVEGLTEALPAKSSSDP
ncbi:MAG: hypothetical protein IT453_18570 [Planctomycetes bacterium]|nr:hypothetical protein [Planctomycetota bacterium]